MGTGLASAMQTELQGQARVFPVFELTINGTTYRFAAESIASESQGLYKPYVTHWGTITRAAGAIQDYSMKTPRVTVDLLDEERTIQKAIGGPASGSVVGSTAKIILRSNYVTAVNHYTLIDGVISDYRLVHDRTWQFVVSPDTNTLNAETNLIPIIRAVDWPNAPTASLGQEGQLVYGKHTSSGISDGEGLIPCICVDEDNDWWYVSVGVLTDSESFVVWKNGSIDSNAWFRENKYINGRWYTIVRDVNGLSSATDDIAVDTSGVDSVGDGTGTLLDLPVDIIQNFLANFVYNDYPFGTNPTAGGGHAWYTSSSAPINTTHFDETSTLLNHLGYTCSMIVRSNDSPMTIFNNWCKTFKVHPFWSWDWNIAVRPFKFAPETVYIDDMHIHQVGHKVLSSISSDANVNSVVSKIIMEYLYMDNAGSYSENNYVQDTNKLEIITESDQLKYGPASKY